MDSEYYFECSGVSDAVESFIVRSRAQLTARVTREFCELIKQYRSTSKDLIVVTIPSQKVSQIGARFHDPRGDLGKAIQSPYFLVGRPRDFAFEDCDLL